MSNFHIFQCEVFNTEDPTHIENFINGETYEIEKTPNRWNQNIKKIEELTLQDSM